MFDVIIFVLPNCESFHLFHFICEIKNIFSHLTGQVTHFCACILIHFLCFRREVKKRQLLQLSRTFVELPRSLANNYT